MRKKNVVILRLVDAGASKPHTAIIANMSLSMLIIDITNNLLSIALVLVIS